LSEKEGGKKRTGGEKKRETDATWAKKEGFVAMVYRQGRLSFFQGEKDLNQGRGGKKNAERWVRARGGTINS